MERIHYPIDTVLAPALSNIVYLIPSVLLFKRNYIVESVELILLVFFSLNHHLCGGDPNRPIFSYCIMDNAKLSLFDDLFSLYAIMNCFIIYYKVCNNRVTYIRLFLIYSSFFIYLGSKDVMITGLYCISINCTIFFIQMMNTKLNYHQFAFIRKPRISYILLTIAYTVTAIYLKLNDSSIKDENEETNLYHFALYHSLWHVFSAFALSVLILAIPVTDLIENHNSILI